MIDQVWTALEANVDMTSSQGKLSYLRHKVNKVEEETCIKKTVKLVEMSTLHIQK